MEETLTSQVCRLYAGFGPPQMSEAALWAAKRVLLDATGVMLGASGMAHEARGFARVAEAMGPGPCHVLGTGITASPVMAALANGALAHALDFEDSFDLAPGHPNASLVPALLALAQANGPIDGERFLAALVAGCDLACRMGLALRQRMEVGGWYPPPILAGYGAALGASHLLGLDDRQMADALSLVLCQVTMPGEIKYSQGTVIRAVREAFPAQVAVQSALLARQGLAGFEEVLEGKAGFYALYAGGRFDPQVLLAPLGDPFWIEQLTFKPWPSCRGTHPFIQMALDLQGRHGFAADEVDSVAVELGPMQRMLVEPVARKQAPQVAIDAKFSVPFCIASALVRGAVTLDSFAERALRDPPVLALAARVSFAEPEDAATWRGDAGRMVITLRSGEQFAAALDRARGTPEAPLSDADLVAKFIDCAMRAARPLSRAQATDMAAAILSLEACDDVGAIFAR